MSKVGASALRFSFKACKHFIQLNSSLTVWCEHLSWPSKRKDMKNTRNPFFSTCSSRGVWEHKRATIPTLAGHPAMLQDVLHRLGTRSSKTSIHFIEQTKAGTFSISWFKQVITKKAEGKKVPVQIAQITCSYKTPTPQQSEHNSTGSADWSGHGFNTHWATWKVLQMSRYS